MACFALVILPPTCHVVKLELASQGMLQPALSDLPTNVGSTGRHRLHIPQKVSGQGAGGRGAQQTSHRRVGCAINLHGQNLVAWQPAPDGRKQSRARSLRQLPR